MNWRELLKFDPMRELRALYELTCDIQNRVVLLEERLARPIPVPPPPPRYLVIWGKLVPNEVLGDPPPWRKGKPLMVRPRPAESVRETVFCIPVPSVLPGTSTRVHHDVYCLFKMTRWLLIGEGAVSNILIGQNLQGRIGSGPVLSGIAGRMGEGSFDTADVGVRITFEVSS